MDWTLVLTPAVALVTGYLTFKAATRANRANEQNSTLAWAKELRASEIAARKEAEESRERGDRIRDEADADVARLRADVEELRLKLTAASRMVEQVTDKLRMVQNEVWRPEPNMDALRRLVGRPSSGGNGG